MDIERAKRDAAERMGGLPAEPRVEYIEVAADEIIEEAPLRPSPVFINSTVYIHQLDTGALPLRYDDVDRLDPDWAKRPLPIHTVALDAGKWEYRLWVPDFERYDPTLNVLALMGHWRIYRFRVWKERETDGETK